MYKFKLILAAVIAITITAMCNAQSTMSWSGGPNLLFPRDTASAVTLTNGNIYVLGGNTTNLLSVEVLAAGSSSFATTTPLQTARIGICALPVGTSIYGVGGKDGRRAIRDLTSYTPGGTVTNVKSMTTARYLEACTNGSGGVYAIGGKDATEAPQSTVERFIGGRWIAVASLPETRFNFAATTDNLGNVVTFGGTTPSAAATNTVLKFDGTNWTNLAPMPIATSGSAVVAGANKLIYVIGGNSGSGPINAVQVYHIDSDTWTLGTPLPAALSNTTAVINPAGNIMVIGGIGTGNVSTSSTYTSPQESAPPVITSFPVSNATVGTLYQYGLSSSGNPAASYSLLNAPAGMTIAGSVISWTPTIGQSGVADVTVRATNPAGFGDQSFQVFVAPPPPTGFAASNVTANSATLTWNALQPEAGTATYNLYELIFRGRGGTAFVPVATGMTQTIVNIGGLGAGTTHRYALSSVVNGVESSRNGAGVVFTTLIPAAPTGVTVTSNTQGTVTLSWTAPATSQVPIVGYRVFDSVATPQLLFDNVTATTATITGLVPGTTHFFYVVSIDANGNQSFTATTGGSTVIAFGPTIGHSPAFPRPTALGGGFFPEQIVGVIGDSLMLITQEGRSSAGVRYTLNATGTPAPTFSLISAPAGMAIDPVTGAVSWTGVSGPTGTFTATARATNSEGFADLTFSYIVYPAGTDLLSPSSVQMFTALVSNITRTSATITWTPSTDNVGVAGYNIYAVSPILICGTVSGCPALPLVSPIAVVTGNNPTVTLNNLTPGSGYSYWIEAFDAAGNRSFMTQGIQRNFSTLP